MRYFDVAQLLVIQPVAAAVVQAPLEIARFRAKAVDLVARKQALCPKLLDLALDGVDPRLERTDLAVIVVP